MMFPSWVIKRLQENRQAQRVPRTPQLNPEYKRSLLSSQLTFEGGLGGQEVAKKGTVVGSALKVPPRCEAAPKRKRKSWDPHISLVCPLGWGPPSALQSDASGAAKGPQGHCRQLPYNRGGGLLGVETQEGGASDHTRYRARRGRGDFPSSALMPNAGTFRGTEGPLLHPVHS